MIVTLWIRVGFTMMIYLAGLQGGAVLKVYEAGQGGGDRRLAAVPAPRRCRWSASPSFFLLIMNVIYSFQVFDLCS